MSRRPALVGVSSCAPISRRAEAAGYVLSSPRRGGRRRTVAQAQAAAVGRTRPAGRDDRAGHRRDLERLRPERGDGPRAVHRAVLAAAGKPRVQRVDRSHSAAPGGGRRRRRPIEEYPNSGPAWDYTRRHAGARDARQAGRDRAVAREGPHRALHQFVLDRAGRRRRAAGGCRPRHRPGLCRQGPERRGRAGRRDAGAAVEARRHDGRRDRRDLDRRRRRSTSTRIRPARRRRRAISGTSSSGRSVPYDEARKAFGFKASARTAATLRKRMAAAGPTPGDGARDGREYVFDRSGAHARGRDSRPIGRRRAHRDGRARAGARRERQRQRRGDAGGGGRVAGGRDQAARPSRRPSGR